MKTNRILSTLLISTLWFAALVTAQTPAAPKLTTEELALQWFDRLNELDDWYISVNGEEGNQAVVDRFLDLYATDAHFQVGPNAKQIGQVTYNGKEGIRKWTSDFSRTRVGLQYRPFYKTLEEKTIQPIYVIQPPWGGSGAAVEFVASWRNREDRKQFTQPGSVFLLFNKDGKVQNVRIYMAADEIFETAGGGGF
jgi:hypothetical protein